MKDWLTQESRRGQYKNTMCEEQTKYICWMMLTSGPQNFTISFVQELSEEFHVISSSACS